MKKVLLCLMVALLSFSALTGCYHMGKATGEGAEEAEKGADSFEEGYEEGKDN